MTARPKRICDLASSEYRLKIPSDCGSSLAVMTAPDVLAQERVEAVCKWGVTCL